MLRRSRVRPRAALLALASPALALLAHRTLAPGRYRAVVSATTAGESARRTVRLRIKDGGRGLQAGRSKDTAR